MNAHRKQRKDRPWSDYPLGTKAHAIIGGHWTRTALGWKASSGGGTFPTPGGDAFEVTLPDAASEGEAPTHAHVANEFDDCVSWCPACRAARAAAPPAGPTSHDSAGECQNYITCPYCGEVNREACDYPTSLRGDGDCMVIDCGSCEREFRVTLRVTYAYRADPIPVAAAEGPTDG